MKRDVLMYDENVYAHVSVREFALARTVVNVERVGLQYVSVISACSVAERCGDSVRQHGGKKEKAHVRFEDAELIP